MKPIVTTLALLLASPALVAATYQPTRFDDPTPSGCLPLDCSLREAVIAANSNPGADRIVMKSGTFTLTLPASTPFAALNGGPLKITESVDIIGAGSALTRVMWSSSVTAANPVYAYDSFQNAPINLGLHQHSVSGGRNSCIRFLGNSSIPRSHLTLNSTTVEKCSFTNGSGGAIHMSNANLTLDRAVLRDNSATFGGALALRSIVDVDSRASEISGNRATSDGGAIHLYGFDATTSVVWVDSDGTQITGNRSDGNGGAIFLSGNVTLALSSLPSSRQMTLSRNVATGNGGAIGSSSPIGAPGRSLINRVRLVSNTAASGGGVYAAAPLSFSDSEISSNTATSGDGGGVAFVASYLTAPRQLERVSLHNNSALLGGGGALTTQCVDVEANNLSIDGNLAAANRGQGIEALGRTTLRHISMLGTAGISPAIAKRSSSSCAALPLRISNSVLVGACASMVAGEIVSAGGNQLGASASTCPMLSGLDQQQATDTAFSLVWASYGGPFRLLGWAPGAPAPQRNFGLGIECTSTDARGFPRADGLCDSGAFEQQP